MMPVGTRVRHYGNGGSSRTLMCGRLDCASHHSAVGTECPVPPPAGASALRFSTPFRPFACARRRGVPGASTKANLSRDSTSVSTSSAIGATGRSGATEIMLQVICANAFGDFEIARIECGHKVGIDQ